MGELADLQILVVELKASSNLFPEVVGRGMELSESLLQAEFLHPATNLLIMLKRFVCFVGQEVLKREEVVVLKHNR